MLYLVTDAGSGSTGRAILVDNNFLQLEDFEIADIQLDGQRHFVFASEYQLNLLRQARRWYIDGTFKILGAPFKKPGQRRGQLFSIHAFIEKDGETQQFPLVFCLMSRQTKADYVEVLQAVNRRLGQMDVEGFVVDFEQAAWLVIRDAPETQRLVSYVENQWMHNTVFPTSSWSVYRQTVRTNNDVEGWHHRFIKTAAETGLQFYKLVPLRREADLVQLAVRGGDLQRNVRGRSKFMERQINNIWDSYDSGQISTSRLLKRCGELYGVRT